MLIMGPLKEASLCVFQRLQIPGFPCHLLVVGCNLKKNLRLKRSTTNTSVPAFEAKYHE